MAWPTDSGNMMELDLGDDVDSAPAVVNQPQSAPLPDLDLDTPAAEASSVQMNPNGYWTASPEFFEMYEKHDLIFRMPTSKGEKLLGYNIGDNAYSVAAEFIAKHNLDDGSLGVDVTMRNSIANSIISKVATIDIEKTRAEKKRREQTFIPSGGSTPRSRQSPRTTSTPTEKTGLTDAQRKELKESEAKRKVEAEKARKALRLKKLADQKHREEIKEKLRLDKLERMSARKSARSTVNTSSAKKNPNLVPIMRGGEVTYVDKTATQKPESSYAEEKEERYEPDEDPVRQALRGLLEGSCPPKQDWTLQLMMTKFQLQGPDKLVEDMESVGFSQAEITNKLSIIMMKLSMERQKVIEQRRKAGGGGQIPAHLMPDTETPETQKFSAYAGSGQKLGSTTVSSVTSPRPVTSANVPVKELVVDETADTTTIRVSLHSGKRLRLKVNHTHTIEDIQSHVESLAPPPLSKTTVLMNSFPRKPLTNLSMTVKEAGLLNSAIIQSLR